ncbi:MULTISPECIES: lantibiotic dehydratase family protein [unclassified Sphingobacterium]|uniref:lantibiotic dehydratase family protein n=1 Tax=unclassified Sphingobacterium TaxID=2609468 RepID=UPI00104E0782|nr:MULTISPECIES: lantibiotic dehydratase family protein [unclassified Sphingobacterium]MCS3557566.1 hypothetical protein [Sphingobacterium sp. JUb21]TCQ95789.1 lantibiotic biosynthesis dehydratase-like protein [Sphingobacterium sp. JUb20]
MIPYHAFNKIIFRVPQFSFSDYITVLKSANSLYEKFQEPIFQEAIYISSPILYSELTKLLKFSTNEKTKIKIENSLVKYFSRMSTRCTPFGLFAGCIVGEIGVQSNVELILDLDLIPRLDNEVVCYVRDFMLQILDRKMIDLQYYPNPTLYKSRRNIRYYECSDIVNGKSAISEIADSKLLNEILQLTEAGCTIGTLITFFIDKGFEKEESEEFILDLIDNQVIVDELFYSSIGKDYFNSIVEIFQDDKFLNKEGVFLRDIHSTLKNLPKQSSEQRISSYIKSSKLLLELGVPIDKINQSLFQIEYFKNTFNATIGQKVIDEIKLAIGFLNKITPKNNEDNDLNEFKRAFYKRFEKQKIELLIALDPEIGIGYPVGTTYGNKSTLIDDLIINEPGRIKSHFDVVQQHLRKKNLEALEKGEYEIILTDEDVLELPEDWDDLPNSIFAIFEVIKHNDDDIMLNLKGVNGSSGANLLARFAHCNSKLEDLVTEITAKEQQLNPDIILAEIVYLSKAKLGNVTSRPHIRDYELICFGHSDLPKERRIHVNDLLVYFENGEIILYSKRHNKRVIPKLTNAHNFRMSDSPVYRFLCDLQTQGQRNSLFLKAFDHITNLSSFQPRIKYRNVILKPAFWYFIKEDYQILYNYENDDQLKLLIKKWRLQYSVPRFIKLYQHALELVIDWESLINVKSILDVFRKVDSVKLYEFIFSMEDAIVKDSKGQYVHEVIVPFYKNNLNEH